MKGGSTGLIPIQVSSAVVVKNNQNIIFLIGLNIGLFCFEVNVIGKVYKTKIDMRSAITPPNLFGMARKIA